MKNQRRYVSNWQYQQLAPLSLLETSSAALARAKKTRNILYGITAFFFFCTETGVCNNNKQLRATSSGERSPHELANLWFGKSDCEGNTKANLFQMPWVTNKPNLYLVWEFLIPGPSVMSHHRFPLRAFRSRQSSRSYCLFIYPGLLILLLLLFSIFSFFFLFFGFASSWSNAKNRYRERAKEMIRLGVRRLHREAHDMGEHTYRPSA